MAKTIHPTVQAAIDSKNYTGVILCRMHFDTPFGVQRLCNAYQNIYWDEGAGEVEYTGAGDLASISVTPETSELSSHNIQLTLSGIPSENITQAFSSEYAGRPIYLWYAILNPNTYAVQADSPILFFAGTMDYANIDFGKEATISMNATNRLADWERAKGGRFNHSYQRTYVDPSDTGFKRMVELQNKAVSWGTWSLEDTGSYSSPRTRPRGPGK